MFDAVNPSEESMQHLTTALDKMLQHPGDGDAYQQIYAQTGVAARVTPAKSRDLNPRLTATYKGWEYDRGVWNAEEAGYVIRCLIAIAGEKEDFFLQFADAALGYFVAAEKLNTFQAGMESSRNYLMMPHGYLNVVGKNREEIAVMYREHLKQFIERVEN